PSAARRDPSCPPAVASEVCPVCVRSCGLPEQVAARVERTTMAGATRPSEMADISTADLYDQTLSDGAPVQVAEGRFLAFGRRRAFSGPIRTVKVHEDNALVRSTLEERGEGCVLVIDGGGSLRA